MQKFVVSRDDTIYEAFPDVTLLPDGTLVCVFSECTHHSDRSYSRIMYTESTDRGRSWSQKQPLTDAAHGLPYWNCPRISQLRDGRTVVVVDSVAEKGRRGANVLFFRDGHSADWTGPVHTPASGIVPDRLLELSTGRWLLACHERDEADGYLVQRLWYSDDAGDSWNGPVIVGKQAGLNLCEVSIVEVQGTLVAFMRENSGKGRDCYKSKSTDWGETWGDVVDFPLPACHRPAASQLQDGRVLITHRFMQGGKGWVGWWTQNLFAALTDVESILADGRDGAHARILPIDFDRSPVSDTGYSGFVQFEDGEIYIVNYIVDDAPKAQIRGYSVYMEDFLLEDKNMSL